MVIVLYITRSLGAPTSVADGPLGLLDFVLRRSGRVTPATVHGLDTVLVVG